MTLVDANVLLYAVNGSHRRHSTARHLDMLAGLLLALGTGGNLTSDARLTALAVEHAATVVTYDPGFERFSGVRWAKAGVGR